MSANKKQQSDRVFLTLTLLLTGLGILFFMSAALGIVARDPHIFESIIINQIVLGLIGGGIALVICSKIPYTMLGKYSLPLFIGAILLCLCVFIPGIGIVHGGARRWIDIGNIISVQPAEFLKIAFIIALAGLLVHGKKEGDIKGKLIPAAILLLISFAVLYPQPDTKSFVLMLAAGGAMVFVSGIQKKWLVGSFVVLVIALSALVLTRPYLMERVLTYMNPARDLRGASYQLHQALIAFGSGGVIGNGLGQSIQKFGYLPEPHGDSIFAVIGEETGFIGTTTMIVLYVLFALRGLRIAKSAKDLFGRLLATGLVILLVAQSFLNIGSIIGILPLTGVPLVFVSHGGTSLLLSLAAVGIILSISKGIRNV